MREERVTARMVFDAIFDKFMVHSPCPFCSETLRLHHRADNLYLMRIDGVCPHLAGYSIGSTAGTAIEHQRFTFIYQERNGH